ncbi:hypothetical protein G9464_01265 [Halostella sp. JP-L12]|uniref:DUF7553 family protein n=1 Tax=Halostella TaxID=1843185 RepID=UPI000EF7C6CC|nr:MULTISPECIES: hypothetical protein [Halostella]NHN46229.1 hypothetical protein [Halostella sp. JP-L12]
MSREELQRASELLREASEAADDAEARERLGEQADEFADLASADRDPDHGRLARHERIVDDAASGENETVRENVEEAIERVHAFRETIEGV